MYPVLTFVVFRTVLGFGVWIECGERLGKCGMRIMSDEDTSTSPTTVVVAMYPVLTFLTFLTVLGFGVWNKCGERLGKCGMRIMSDEDTLTTSGCVWCVMQSQNCAGLGCAGLRWTLYPKNIHL